MKLFDQEKWEEWLERMKAPYRLIIRNDETLEERASFRLSILNVYVLLSTIVVIVATSVVMLIAYTPIKRYIPGYAGGNIGQEALDLAREVSRLEEELGAQVAYTENIRKLMVGDIETLDDMQVPKLSKETQASLKAVPTSEEDRQVRQEAELERLGGVARQVRSTNFSNGGKPIEQLYFVVPVRGEISSEFAVDKSHFGIDLVAPKNTAVRATMDGYVFLSDWTLETGNTIGIQHANNIISFYKHNAQLLKKAGNFVRAGEAIAIIGNTGEKTDGPHLHFELWHKGTPVNPADYIAF